jgi:hypothetical protein
MVRLQPVTLAQNRVTLSAPAGHDEHPSEVAAPVRVLELLVQRFAAERDALVKPVLLQSQTETIERNVPRLRLVGAVVALDLDGRLEERKRLASAIAGKGPDASREAVLGSLVKHVTSSWGRRARFTRLPENAGRTNANIALTRNPTP